LNELPEVKRLNNVFEAINNSLRRQQKSIKNVVSIIQDFGDAIGQVSQVVAGLTALVTLL
jgi:hypothetical protein